MTAVYALALILVGALITRSVYRLGLTAGVRLGYGMGHADATATARRLVEDRIAGLSGGENSNGN